MSRHIYELGLPFAVLLPTDSMQRVGVGKLLYNYGSHPYMFSTHCHVSMLMERKNLFVLLRGILAIYLNTNKERLSYFGGLL
jgi:hypothetical protein